MSGHSKWATIHRGKEIKDQARGKLFTKYAKLVTIAAKTGGGPNPDTNFKLRDAIDKARSVNMPKENIDRAIKKAQDAGELHEVVYEGFGPAGISVIVEAATDNKNRTVAEIKNIFEKGGGNMGSPGSVSYNFEAMGLVVVEKSYDPAGQMLHLIDLGATDIEDGGAVLEVYISDSTQTRQVREKIVEAGFNVKSFDLIMRPKMNIQISDGETIAKVTTFVESLEDHDDVHKVFTNADILETVLNS